MSDREKIIEGKRLARTLRTEPEADYATIPEALAWLIERELERIEEPKGDRRVLLCPVPKE